LIELLVSLGVILVLAALAASALVGAKRAAVRAACTSNLRQIAAGIRLYCGDYADTVPVAGLVIPAIGGDGDGVRLT
jgi:type II secretory pathway pseudopilin PulG